MLGLRCYRHRLQLSQQKTDRILDELNVSEKENVTEHIKGESDIPISLYKVAEVVIFLHGH